MDLASAEPIDQLAGQPSRNREWIQSPSFDLVFFILSPLLGLGVLLAAPGGPSLLALAVGMTFGIPHYLSTFTFYCWDDTRAYHRMRWAAFFGGPLFIVLSVGLLATFRVPYIIQVAVFFWNTWHVARQNCGILSIYRHRAGDLDPHLKEIANSAVICTSAALACWHTQWYPTLFTFLTLLSPILPQVLHLGLILLAAVALLRLGLSLWKRARSERPPTLPELAFLLTSLLLFHPYLWIHDANRATLGMLLGHFVQYLGIVWLVHHRKFTAPSGSLTQRALATVSANLGLLVTVCLMTGGVAIALQLAVDGRPHYAGLYEVGILTLSLVHFYLDGLFWAFRDRQVRRSLGPYLFSGPSRVAT